LPKIAPFSSSRFTHGQAKEGIRTMHKNCQLFLQINAVADFLMLAASINAAKFWK